MPTKKPRIAVTLEPHVFETIDRFAELQGRSRGRVVADLLESITPALQRTVAILDAAQQAPRQVQQGLANTIENMERELVGGQASALAQMDWILGKAGEQEEKTPGPVTRGSGLGKSLKSHKTGNRRNGG